MNNQSLSLRRLGLVMKHDFLNNLKSYLLQIIFLGIAMLVIICIVLPHSAYYPQEYSVGSVMNTLKNWFFAFLFGSGCLFASTMGNNVSTKSQRISTLMLPASMLEKYLAQWIKYVIIFPIVFYAEWLLMNVLGNGIIELIFKSTSVPVMTISKIAEVAQLDNGDMLQILLLYLCTQSIFILGAAFWPRFSCIKTLITMWVLGMIEALVLWFAVLRPMFLSGKFINMDYGSVINESTIVGILIFMTLFNWIFPYFRFKETDVVQRI